MWCKHAAVSHSSDHSDHVSFGTNTLKMPKATALNCHSCVVRLLMELSMLPCVWLFFYHFHNHKCTRHECCNT